MTSRRTPIALAAVLLVVLAVPAVPAAFAAAPTAAPSPTQVQAQVQVRAQVRAAAPAVSSQCAPVAGPLTTLGVAAPLTEAVTPHCCSQQEIDLCRSTCKDQGPGCKGQIACRAGECDCTCACP
jgi:hypothetical protein